MVVAVEMIIDSPNLCVGHGGLAGVGPCCGWHDPSFFVGRLVKGKKKRRDGPNKYLYTLALLPQSE